MQARSQVLFSSKEQHSLPEVIDFLRTLANRLEQQGHVILAQAERQVEVKPEGNIVLETKYETKGEKQKLEIEIEWRPGSSSVSVL